MRFWGDTRTPIRGYTISQVNYRNEDLIGCGGNFAIGSPTRSVVFPYHPDDAGTAAGAPWRVSQSPRRFSSSRVNAVFDYGFLRGAAVTTGFSAADGSNLALYGTEVPFARGPVTRPEPCTVLQTSVMADLVADPARGDAVRLALGRAYLASRQGGQNHAAGLVVANLASVSWRIQSLGNARANPAQLTQVTAAEVVPDTTPCSSAFDFVPAPGSPASHYGACYAPIMSPARGYSSSATNPTTNGVSYLAATAPTYESWSWAGNGGPRHEDNAITRAARQALADHLRLTLFFGGDAAERAAQQYAGPSIGHPTALRWANPARFLNNHGVPDNRQRQGRAGDRTHWERAAQSLYEHARCSVSFHRPLVDEQEETVVPAPDGVTIRLLVPNLGQVGGQVSSSMVSATADLSLRCGGRPCGADVRILRFTWDLAVAGTGSYQPCSSSTQLGCEYRVARHTNSTRSPKTAESYELHFYNATGRSESVQAAVRNIVIVAEKRTTRTSMIEIPINPADPTKTIWIPLEEEYWVPVTIPVSVVDARTGRVLPDASRSFRVINATPG
jgi:hypothetical protein